MNIAITGIGEVNSLDFGAEAVFNQMCAGKTAFRPITRFDTEAYEIKNGGQLSEYHENLLREKYPEVELGIAMILQAGNEALKHSASTGKLALVLGTNFGMMETCQWAWQERLDTGTMDNETYSQCDLLLDIVGSRLHADGPLMQISMSCASGTAALRTAADILRQGRARRVLVISYDTITSYCWCGLSNLHTMTQDTVRPFDADRSGTIFSEGAAALLLEASPASTPLAYLRGCATNNNAFHITAPPKEAEGSYAVMQEALKDAGLSAEAIDHICAHATGTKGNDSTEAAAMRHLFGSHLSEMSLGAHKSQLGHLLGAASLAEIITTIEAMNHGILPPNQHLRTLDKVCEGIHTVSTPQNVSISTAITNSAGLGGNNASAVLSRQPGTPAESLDSDRRIYIRSLGWILPSGCGNGPLTCARLIPDATDADALAQANPKQYLNAPKGYMDPCALYQLAAVSLLHLDSLDSTGLATATRYGAQQSAYGFFVQMQQNGPRHASPLIFPHGYASTAGNLAAIHFGISGPHQAFWGNQDIRECLFFAGERLLEGNCCRMLVGANESAPADALPDGRQLLPGAIAMELSLDSSEDAIGSFTLRELADLPGQRSDYGMVASLGTLIQQLTSK